MVIMRKTAQTGKLYPLILDMFYLIILKVVLVPKFVGLPVGGAKKNAIWVPKALVSNI